MADKSFTFFELHFHDGIQLGPKTLKPGEQAADDAATSDSESESAEPTEEGSSGGSVLPKLIGLGVLAAAAYLLRKLLDGGPSGLDALDDIEDLEEFGSGEADEDDAEEDTEEDDAVAIEVTSGDGAGSERSTGLLLAAAVTLLLLLAFAAKKLLGGDVEAVEVPDELAEE